MTRRTTAGDRGSVAEAAQRDVRRPPSRTAQLHASIGNQALLRAGLANAMGTTLPLGSARDEGEAEAAARGTTVRARSYGGGAGPPALPSGGAGVPLPASVRSTLEPVVGADLTTVRVHATPPDRALAAAMSARAFTVGEHIWLGPRADVHDPALLGHEAAHVVQQRDGRARIQRAIDDQSFDPDAIRLDTITNVELQHRTAEVTSWRRGHGPEHPAYPMITRLGERLAVERTRRIALGHVWLSEIHEPRSVELYTFAPRGQATGVFTVSRDVADGVATERGDSPVVTRAQLDAFLREQQIPTMSVGQYVELSRAGAAMAASRTLSIARPDAMMNEVFTSAPHAGWIGGPGEASWTASLPRNAIDTNTLSWRLPNGQPWTGPPRSFPVVDTALADWQLMYDVKTSGRPVQTDRLQWYAAQFGDDLSVQQLQNLLRPNVPGNPTRQQLFDRLRFVVPSEDAQPFRDALQNPDRRLDPNRPRTQPIWQQAGFRAMYDETLSMYPETLPVAGGGTQTFNSVAALRSAVTSGQITEAQFFAALANAGNRLAGQTVPNEISSASAATLRDQRIRLGRGPQSQLATRVFDYSEYFAATRMGEGPAMAMSAVRGGPVGGLIAVTIQGVTILIDPVQHPNWQSELGIAGGLGVAGGATGGAAQQVTASMIGRYFIARQAPQSLGLGLGGRAASGGAGGGVASIVMESAQIALESRSHGGREIALREGRAFVIGGVSGAAGAAAGSITGAILTSALTGTAVGTAVPGLGNAVGFIIGLGVGIGIAIAMERSIPRPDPQP